MIYTVGLDIGKKYIDMCIRCQDQNKFYKINNTPEGHQEILNALKSLKVSLVVCEPTGGYEREICITLVRESYKVHRVNTCSFNQFSKSINWGKTDKQDAARLAHFGDIMKLTENFTIEDMQDRLKVYQSQREDLVIALSKIKQRLDHCYDQEILESMHRQLRCLESEIERFENLSAEIIQQIPELEKRVIILSSIPGIGQCIATKLVANFPELGTDEYDHNKLSAIVGVAPYPRDSGIRNGKRFIRGGRRMLRDAFFIAALTGRKKISHINGVYERIIAQDKAKKVAIVACIRRLIALAHSLLKRGETFQVYP